MKPFLKWAGGKYRLVELIKKNLPTGNRLIEPFVGSGALFLNTEYSENLLADSNPDLITLFKIIQKEGQGFISYCQELFVPENNTELAFYQFREEFNNTNDLRRKAALFVYLNRHCFNGLCRYNSKGVFNVPYGRYAKPRLPEEEMYYFYEKSQHAVFEVANFITTMEKAKSGDVVYCDPPYVPLSATSSFTSYSKGSFGLDEQNALADMAKKLQKKGITVVISNHDTVFTNEVYRSAKIITFDVQRFISSDTKNRNAVGELVAVFA
ncbi:MAG: Dam family site-specific DNA-(adenine-N6)-methyltransferase [Methylophilaceae bacterium]|nr:Dam family site-specific DNA-(adenine-N6)-methyltransferase [Methylophilaceae bacterium]